MAFVGSERLTRKAMPLTVLLKMGMVFPGRAPKRLSVARRSGTTRDLAHRIEDARAHGIADDEPTVAAERIVTLAATLSAHDRRTRGHAERVRAFTDLIAEELRLPSSDRDRLRWSALLHDIGKLTVHTHILNKVGTLSDDEWEVMRQHPLEGAKLTAPLAGWLGPWATTIAEHHERFDGRGYPFGLSGQEISTGGRIVAVADCYDTMTSVRSYKRAMSPEKARAELAACAGSQFDPLMVRAFLAVSVSRLRAVAPLSWLGSLPFGNAASPLARALAAGGRVGLSAVGAAAAVFGITVARPAHNPAFTTVLSAASHRDAVPVHGTEHRSPAAGGAGAGSSSGASASGSPSTGRSHSGTRGGASHSPTGKGSGNQSNGVGSGPTTTAPAGADPSGQTPVGGTGTPSEPTTTVGSATPVGSSTTTAATATTTTTTAPPPLIAPSGLTLMPGCQLVVVGPQIALVVDSKS